MSNSDEFPTDDNTEHEAGFEQQDDDFGPYDRFDDDISMSGALPGPIDDDDPSNGIEEDPLTEISGQTFGEVADSEGIIADDIDQLSGQTFGGTDDEPDASSGIESGTFDDLHERSFDGYEQESGIEAGEIVEREEPARSRAESPGKKQLSGLIPLLAVGLVTFLIGGGGGYFYANLETQKQSDARLASEKQLSIKASELSELKLDLSAKDELITNASQLAKNLADIQPGSTETTDNKDGELLAQLQETTTEYRLVKAGLDDAILDLSDAKQKTNMLINLASFEEQPGKQSNSEQSLADRLENVNQGLLKINALSKQLANQEAIEENDVEEGLNGVLLANLKTVSNQLSELEEQYDAKLKGELINELELRMAYGQELLLKVRFGDSSDKKRDLSTAKEVTAPIVLLAENLGEQDLIVNSLVLRAQLMKEDENIEESRNLLLRGIEISDGDDRKWLQYQLEKLDQNSQEVSQFMQTTLPIASMMGQQTQMLMQMTFFQAVRTSLVDPVQWAQRIDELCSRLQKAEQGKMSENELSTLIQDTEKFWADFEALDEQEQNNYINSTDKLNLNKIPQKIETLNKIQAGETQQQSDSTLPLLQAFAQKLANHDEIKKSEQLTKLEDWTDESRVNNHLKSLSQVIEKLLTQKSMSQPPKPPMPSNETKKQNKALEAINKTLLEFAQSVVEEVTESQQKITDQNRKQLLAEATQAIEKLVSNPLHQSFVNSLKQIADLLGVGFRTPNTPQELAETTNLISDRIHELISASSGHNPVVPNETNPGDPNTPFYFYNQGLERFYDCNFPATIEMMDRALETRQDARFLYFRALANQHLGNMKQAEQDILAAVESEKQAQPSSDDVFLALERIQGPRRLWIESYRKELD